MHVRRYSDYAHTCILNEYGSHHGLRIGCYYLSSCVFLHCHVTEF